MGRTIWVDVVLLVLTLGLYMPYWMYERNRKLRQLYPTYEVKDNLPWLVAALVLTFFGAAISYGDPFYAGILQVAAILCFSAGVFILAYNGMEIADLEGAEWRFAPLLLAGSAAAAFLSMQLGIALPMGPAYALSVVLTGALGILLWYTWHDLDALIPDPFDQARQGAATS